MSVKFSFARLSLCAQVDSFSETPRSFVRVKVGLYGFTGGSTRRVKNFATTLLAQHYLNKLLIGNWITDVEYFKAFTAVEDLSYVSIQTANDGNPSSCYLEQRPGDTVYSLRLNGEKIVDPLSNYPYRSVKFEEASS